jgi:cytochrome c5
MKRGEKKAFLWIGIGVAAIAAITITLEVQHQDLQVVSILKDAKKAVSMHKYGGATNIPVGINPDGLPDAKSRGATMLTLYCAQCHELPPPSMHTTSEWRGVIARMKEFMRLRGGGMLMRTITPPEEDWAILESYLDTHAQVPLDKKQTSDLDTPAGKAFQETCSQCHGAPSPATHTTNEWPRVVLRMKSHIIRTGKTMPSQDGLMQIIEYLQTHSKSS